jgi:SAM-dependent methyltransferase
VNPDKSYLHMRLERRTQLPPEFQDDDVRFPEALVEELLRRYTGPGDLVLDPFAGFGTMLVVAEEMDRVPWGVEYDARRARFIRSRLQQPERLIQGDSRRLSELLLPAMDFALTSPPFMHRCDPEDPFTAYTQPGQGYASYLETIRCIYAQLRQLLKPGARAVLEVANLRDARGVTPLAWDIAAAVGQELTYEGEIVVLWDQDPGFGYDHSYCLVFRKPEES